MFASADALIAALREFVRLLRLGKLLPIDSLAFVESPTTMIVKSSSYEVGWFKYRLRVDLTANRVNGQMHKIDCSMITLDEFIRHTKKGHVISKMDVADFFLYLPLRKDHLTFFGVQNPLTGQTYLFAFLPFGARCSPPLANHQMCNLTGAVANELRRRERGDTPLPTCSHISVVMRPNVIDHTRNQDALHAKSALFLTGLSTLTSFVDDAIQSAPTEVLGNELMAIAGHVFQITCIFEKVKKRAAPAQEQEVLGLWFCTLSGYLSVPTEKRARLLALVLEALEMFDRQGAISIEALNSLVGKLQDASQGHVCASFFLHQLRMPLNCVLHLLLTRHARREFLVPFFMFARMRDDLQAWATCLLVDAGAAHFQYSMQPDGYWGTWHWDRSFFDGPLPLGVFNGATDASKKAGGFSFGGARSVKQWTGKEKSFHINVLETLVPVWFLQDNGPYVRGQRGVIWMDSAVAIAALNSGKSKNKVLAWYAHEFKLLCLKYSVQICFAHIHTL